MTTVNALSNIQSGHASAAAGIGSRTGHAPDDATSSATSGSPTAATVQTDARAADQPIAHTGDGATIVGLGDAQTSDAVAQVVLSIKSDDQTSLDTAQVQLA